MNEWIKMIYIDFINIYFALLRVRTHFTDVHGSFPRAAFSFDGMEESNASGYMPTDTLIFYLHLLCFVLLL